MKCGDESKEKGVCGGGTEGEIGDEKGVVVKDGKGGKEGVRDVKGGGDKEDLEGGRGCSDESDGVGFMKAVITIFWVNSKVWVRPQGKGRMGRK